MLASPIWKPDYATNASFFQGLASAKYFGRGVGYNYYSLQWIHKHFKFKIFEGEAFPINSLEIILQYDYSDDVMTHSDGEYTEEVGHVIICHHVM